MKQSFNKLAFLLLFSPIFFNSCDDIDEDINSFPIFKVDNIEPSRATYGQLITIHGSFPSVPSDSIIIHIGGVNISSLDCYDWKTYQVMILVPDSSISGTIYLINNQDTSNKVSIEIIKRPDYQELSINSGNFILGSISGANDETPINEITLTRNLYVGKYEVNNLLYRNLMNLTPEPNFAELPVNYITWHEAILFCNEMSKIDDLDTCYFINNVTFEYSDELQREIPSFEVEFDYNKKGWRLPTETEWEYICRAGSTNDFFDEVDKVAWYSANSGFRLRNSGLKLANAWGLNDTHGNVAEWCFDYYDAQYYTQIPKTDPIGPVTGTNRVIRGGSISSGLSQIRASSRSGYNEQLAGIRLVRNR